MAFLISLWVIIPLILIILSLEHYRQHGWAVICTIALAIVTSLYLELNALAVGIIAVIYLPLGVACSVWRWKRYCMEVVRRCKDEMLDRDVAKERLVFTNTENISKIIYWVITWPFAMAERFVGDFIEMIRMVVTNWFRSAYEKISASAIKEIDEMKY